MHSSDDAVDKPSSSQTNEPLTGSNIQTEDDFKQLSDVTQKIRDKVAHKKDLKSLRKMFGRDVISFESVSESEIEYEYFQFIQILKRHFPGEDLKTLCNKISDEVDDDEFKEILPSLLIKFWSQVLSSIEDNFLKHHSHYRNR